MFAMRQADILMKHQAMNDSQHTIHTINRQQDNPTEITGPDDEPAYQEKQDKGNAHRTHITGKALGFLAKIEEAEDKDRTNHRMDKPLLYKRHHFPIYISQCSQYHQRVASGYPIDAIHKVVSIDDARADYQSDYYPPP